jgi:hypothetical protein
MRHLTKASPTEKEIPMPLTTGGWTVMLLSVGSVLILVCFCLQRVLRLPPPEFDDHLKGPLEIDTGDVDDAD